MRDVRTITNRQIVCVRRNPTGAAFASACAKHALASVRPKHAILIRAVIVQNADFRSVLWRIFDWKPLMRRFPNIFADFHPEFSEHVLSVTIFAPAPEIIAPGIFDQLAVAGGEQFAADVFMLIDLRAENAPHDTDLHVIPIGAAERLVPFGDFEGLMC